MTKGQLLLQPSYPLSISTQHTELQCVSGQSKRKVFFSCCVQNACDRELETKNSFFSSLHSLSLSHTNTHTHSHTYNHIRREKFFLCCVQNVCDQSQRSFFPLLTLSLSHKHTHTHTYTHTLSYSYNHIRREKFFPLLCSKRL